MANQVNCSVPFFGPLLPIEQDTIAGRKRLSFSLGALILLGGCHHSDIETDQTLLNVVKTAYVCRPMVCTRDHALYPIGSRQEILIMV